MWEIEKWICPGLQHYPPLWIEVGLTSTLTVAVESWIRLFATFTVHELVVSVVALVSMQEEHIAASSTRAAQLPSGAIHFFVTRVVAETLPTPLGDVCLVCECFSFCTFLGWW